MRVDRLWKKTGKKISIQGTDVAGFDKSKVEYFNFHKMGHFVRECRAPRSQDIGRRDNYRQGSKVEEQALKALMAIDGVGWDWSYMANDKENHALTADEETPTEFALMAKTSAESKVFDSSLCSKAWLAQVEARLVEHRSQELKYYKKIRVLEFKTESRANSSKDLDSLLESQRLDKNKEGLGYSVIPPPSAQIYSPPKKDMSWTGLPEFKDDTITDYSRPSPIVESSPDDAQNKNPSVTTTEASPSTISPKPFIKFVKANDSPTKSKTDKVKTAKKPPIKYAEQYKKPTKKPNGSSQNNIDDKGYWDSGYSRHMTGNISYLFYYEPFDEGYVSFGQGGCKITRKGTIKTGKLKFENVYFVKDLKYNLFSVSQICDNKNNILFTDKECIVLGQNFKLSNDDNVLLRTPRQHNMYSIDLNNIVLHKDLTCLVAKAFANECLIWHRRLGFLKPFGCHVMILNTLDNLEKFEAKGDEGTKYAASQEVKKDVSSLRYIALPNWVHDALLESSLSKPQDDCSTDAPESSGNSNPTATLTNPLDDQLETLTVETPIPTVSSPLLTACLNDSLEPLSDTRLISKRVASHVETPSLYNILTLTNRFEGILGVTTHSVDSDGVEADVSNMEITITASPTPTLRIHKDHPKNQIISLVDTPIQTRNKSKENFISSSDLLCWNIILKGNSAKSMTTYNDGNLKIRPPVTLEEHQQVQREEKARTILLSALPNEHIDQVKAISLIKKQEMVAILLSHPTKAEPR
nr:ribonuclease H-like domain-containing protein [Tanacetum cinerariifolium]